MFARAVVVDLQPAGQSQRQGGEQIPKSDQKNSPAQQKLRALQAGSCCVAARWVPYTRLKLFLLKLFGRHSPVSKMIITLPMAES